MTTVLIAVALAALSVVYALTSLTFATSTRALLPPGRPYVERYTQYEREFGDLDSIAIVVDAPSLPEATLYANRLVRQLRAENVPLKRIAYRIDPKQFEGRGLLYLSKDRLANIRDAVFDYQEFMEAFAAHPTLDQLAEGMATQIANAFMANFIDLGLAEGKGASDLKFVQDLVALIGARLERPGPYQSPFGTLFAVPGADNPGAGYFLSEDQKLLFILAEPETQRGSFTGDQRAIEGIRGVIASLKREFPEVAVGVTGKPALQNDEMVAAFRDSERATLLAFALTLGLLLAAFVRFGKPVLMLLVLALSLCWSIGIATLVIGHLSLFSVMFISIVIGIGIDYGIYFLFRYEEELFLGRNLKEAIEITATRSGPGMLLGAVTAGGTFYVLWLTDFRGVRELGFIAGTAIVLAWLATMTVFPAVLVLLDRRHAGRPAGTIPRAIALERMHVPFVERLVSYPKTVLVMAAALTAVSAWGLRYIEFDYNLLNLQAVGTESVVWEKRILATAGRSGFTALASADTLDELRQKYKAFHALPSVSEVDSVLLLIPEDQPEKLKIIGDFAPLVAPVRIGRATSVDPAKLAGALETLKRRFDIAGNEAPEGDVRPKLKLVAEDLGRLILKIRQSDPQVSGPALTHLQNQIYRDFVRSFQRLQDNLSPKPIGLADVPKELRAKFISDRRPVSPADPSRRRHLGSRRRGALRRRPPLGGSRRDRHPDHHLRGPRPDGARLPAGHGLRDLARDLGHRAGVTPDARDGAGAAAARARLDVGVRSHVLLRAQVQHGQRLRASAHPRCRGGVRPEHRPALHGGSRSRRSADRALHDDGRAGQRAHDDRRLRQLDDRRSPRHLRPRPAPHPGHGHEPDRRARRPAGPATNGAADAHRAALGARARGRSPSARHRDPRSRPLVQSSAPPRRLSELGRRRYALET